jgi:hypothetical protein
MKSAHANSNLYQHLLEQEYCSHPSVCLDPDILIIGSGIGLYAATHLIRLLSARFSATARIVLVDAGPFDLIGHIGDQPGFQRRPFILHPERVGGKFVCWGLSIPWPRPYLLATWGRDLSDLTARFQRLDLEMGSHDSIPMSGREFEKRLLPRLRAALPDASVSVAPLALNASGRRWTSTKYVPELIQGEVEIIAHLRVNSLRARGGRISEVCATWMEDQDFVFRPHHVVIATGAERSVPLLSPLIPSCGQYIRDHHRLDFHGVLPPGFYGNLTPDESGVAVLIAEMEDTVEQRVPFHVEIKVAPVKMWREGYMQSSDNLVALSHSDDTIFWQLQVVGAMADPIPIKGNVLNTRDKTPALMTLRDAALHGRLVAAATRIAKALDLRSVTSAFREIGTNHHAYSALRIGHEVDENLVVFGMENLTVLPPTAYYNHACAANPSLKSLVLSEYAMEHIAHELIPGFEEQTVDAPQFQVAEAAYR